MNLSSEAPVLLSVVVIGRNEGERLRRCLDSVCSMKQPDSGIEVIYVDSGSTDGSVDLANNLGIKTICLRPARPSAALGRNAGWRGGRGNYVLFLDGDTVLHPRFVIDSLPEFSRPEIAVVWGHRRELYPQHSLYNRALDLDWIYRAGLTDYCGGDALFRRSVLEETGGFDETLIAGEEPELCRRIRERGFKILHIDRSMTGHDLAITHWKQYWRRALRAGHAFAEVADRSRQTKAPLWVDVCQANQSRALFLLGSVAVGIALTLAVLSWRPYGAAGLENCVEGALEIR